MRAKRHKEVSWGPYTYPVWGKFDKSSRMSSFNVICRAIPNIKQILLLVAPRTAEGLLVVVTLVSLLDMPDIDTYIVGWDVGGCTATCPFNFTTGYRWHCIHFHWTFSKAYSVFCTKIFWVVLLLFLQFAVTHTSGMMLIC